MLNEFRDFIARGNVVDLAVGVIIGGAFGKIVTSLVEDVIMPPVGALLKGVDFGGLYINLSGRPVASLAQAKAEGIPVIGYGSFLNAMISFVIVAGAVFLLVKAVNRIRRTTPAPVETRACPYCCGTIPLAAVRCPQCTSDLAAAAP